MVSRYTIKAVQRSWFLHVSDAYPEILFVDLPKNCWNSDFLLLVKEGNGQSEIAAVFLLLEESQLSILATVEAFKKHKSKWISVRVIMFDKDLTER